MFDDFCACLDSHVLFCVRELPEAIENFLWHLVRRRGGHDRHLGEGDGLQLNFNLKFITQARVFCILIWWLWLSMDSIFNIKIFLFMNKL